MSISPSRQNTADATQVVDVDAFTLFIISGFGQKRGLGVAESFSAMLHTMQDIVKRETADEVLALMRLPVQAAGVRQSMADVALNLRILSVAEAFSTPASRVIHQGNSGQPMVLWEGAADRLDELSMDMAQLGILSRYDPNARQTATVRTVTYLSMLHRQLNAPNNGNAVMGYVQLHRPRGPSGRPDVGRFTPLSTPIL